METQSSRGKKIIVVVGLALLAIVIFIIGFFAGKNSGMQAGTQAAESKYKPLVNIAFPEPPAVMNKVSGIVENVSGNIITFKVNDPNDYLPHLDGSPRATVEKQALVSSATSFSLINYAKLDKNGSATLTALTLGDIKTGNTVTVASDRNIRTSQSFPASSVQVSNY